VKILSAIQKNTATLLGSRLSSFITLFLGISLYLLININIVFAAQITLVWDHIYEPDLMGYKIYYGNSSGNYSESVNIGSPDITTCTIYDLIEGQTYYFSATAYNSNFLESNYSEEISYTVDPSAMTTTTTAIISTSTTTGPTTTTIISGGGGGGGGGGSKSTTTTTVNTTTTTAAPSTTTTSVNTTTTVPATTTTTVPVSECIIESVESTVLPLQSGILNPRLRRILITGTNSKWDHSSEIKINDFNLVIRLRVENDIITALILIPPRLLGFQPGVKDVTIVTGSEACIGTVEIE
jgi:hypothetical protein